MMTAGFYDLEPKSAAGLMAQAGDHFPIPAAAVFPILKAHSG